MNSEEAEGPERARTKLQRTTMLVLAVTLHNIPEGMAVGVVYAGWMSGETSITALELWHYQWELPFRTFQRERSFPFH